MFLWGEQKQCLEQVVKEKGSTCYSCGSPALSADEAEWMLGGDLDVYFKCSECGDETPLTLRPDDYRRCGFDPNAYLRDDVP